MNETPKLFFNGHYKTLLFLLYGRWMYGDLRLFLLFGGRMLFRKLFFCWMFLVIVSANVVDYMFVSVFAGAAIMQSQFLSSVGLTKG